MFYPDFSALEGSPMTVRAPHDGRYVLLRLLRREIREAVILWGLIYVSCVALQTITGIREIALPVVLLGTLCHGIGVAALMMSMEEEERTNDPTPSIGATAMSPIEDSFAYEYIFSRTILPPASPHKPLVLSKFKYKKSPVKAEAEKHGPCCPICLIDWKEGDQLSCGQVCGHLFHHECIQRWGTRSHLCPCCRQSLKKSSRGSTVRYHQEENNALVVESTAASRLYSSNWLVSCQDLAQLFVISPSGERLASSDVQHRRQLDIVGA